MAAMRLRIDIAACLLTGASGCNEHPLAAVEVASVQEFETIHCAPDPPAVDVLLVIDDSASMGEGIHRVAEALEQWASVYDNSFGRLDYRIAVTTSDVRNPWCDSAGNDGAFVASSCRERLPDFVVGASHESPAQDRRAACTDACRHETITTLPTPTAVDDMAAPRPWIQRHRLQHNLPEDLPPVEALPCLGLVGVAGCAYESPLEAAWLALHRTFDPGDPAYGFLRPEAALFVLFVTDELDCSVRPEQASIFDPTGPRALWGDGATAPTSAVCWNAAMQCAGLGDPYRACEEAAKGPRGEAVDDADAVLQPLARYLELLAAIERDKQQAMVTDAQRVFVHVLGGSPDGVDDFDAMTFAESADPQLQAAFGIGPGCTWQGDSQTPAETAFPPGRLREVAEIYAEFGGGLHSLCGYDFTDALACVPGEPRWRQPCVEGCAAESDPTSPRPEVECVLTETFHADGIVRAIPVCEERQADGPLRLDDAQRWVPPDGAESCVLWRTGDDVGEACSSLGNVEYELRRTVERSEGSCRTITCTASDRPLHDCPNLPA
jgi:hypothetical protein